MSRAGKHRLSIAGLVISGLVVVIFLATLRWSFGYFGGGRLAGFAFGLFVFGFPRNPPSPSGWLFRGNIEGLYWLPMYGNGLVGVPLWMLFLALLIPSLIGLRRYRRPLPGHCQKCGYDLTGNVSGMCPECGRRITDGR